MKGDKEIKEIRVGKSGSCFLTDVFDVLMMRNLSWS